MADHAMRDVYLTVNIHDNSKDCCTSRARRTYRILKAMATDGGRAEVTTSPPSPARIIPVSFVSSVRSYWTAEKKGDAAAEERSLR